MAMVVKLSLLVNFAGFMVASASYQTYDLRALRGYQPASYSSSPTYYKPITGYKPSYGYTGYGASYGSRSKAPSYPTYETVGKSGYDLARRSSYSPKPSYSHSPKPASAYKPTIYVYRPRPTSYVQKSYEPSYGHHEVRGYDRKPTYQASSYGHGAGYGRRQDDHSKYDPCKGRKDGDYVLEGEFGDHFPYVDPHCNFVKCANYIAFVNPCSYGTKNDEYGRGFCSYLDHHHQCGYPPKKKDYEDHH